MKNTYNLNAAVLRVSAAVFAFGALTFTSYSQNTWNGAGVPTGTGDTDWTLGTNYLTTPTWSSSTDWNLSTITSNTTLSAGSAGTYAIRDILFGTTSSTITAPQSVQVNGNGTAGSVILDLSRNISVPSPLTSRAILGSDITLNLSNAIHQVRFYQNNSVTSAFPGGAVTPAVAIQSLVTGGGAAATLETLYTAYGAGGNSATPGIVLSNNNNSFNAKIGGANGLSGRIAYTSIGNVGVNSSLGAGTGDNAAIRISSGAILDYIGSGNQTTNRAIEIRGGTPGLYNFASDNSSTLTFNGSFSNIGPSGTITMRLGASQGNTLVFASNITDGANAVTALHIRPATTTYATDGSVVTKTAGGTVILSGENTYTGATTLDAGTTLRLENSSLGSGAVTVASGSTLGGTGTIGGATTVSGTLSPGNSIGILTVNNSLTLNNTATAIFDGGDLVDVNGTLSLATGWKLQLNSSPTWQLGGNTILFTFDTAGANFNLAPSITDNTGLGGVLTLAQIGNNVVLNGYSVIPEPHYWALLPIVLAGLALVRRRKNSLRQS